MRRRGARARRARHASAQPRGAAAPRTCRRRRRASPRRRAPSPQPPRAPSPRHLRLARLERGAGLAELAERRGLLRDGGRRRARLVELRAQVRVFRVERLDAGPRPAAPSAPASRAFASAASARFVASSRLPWRASTRRGRPPGRGGVLDSSARRSVSRACAAQTPRRRHADYAPPRRASLAAASFAASSRPLRVFLRLAGSVARSALSVSIWAFASSSFARKSALAASSFFASSSPAGSAPKERLPGSASSRRFARAAPPLRQARGFLRCVYPRTWSPPRASSRGLLRALGLRRGA